MPQLSKIMPDLFHISSFNLDRDVGVKSELTHLGPPMPVIRAANSLFQKSDMVRVAVTSTLLLKVLLR